MKTKPMYFDIMAAVFAMMAMSFPLQILSIYRVPDFTMVFSKLTYLNWVLIGLFVTISALSFKVKKGVLYLLPLTSGIVFLNNWLVASYGQDFSLGQTITASLAFLGISASFYLPKYHRFLNDPKNRWWVPKPRYQKSIPVQIIFDQNQICSLSYDLSESGIFVQEDDLLCISKLAIGQIIQMQIELPQGRINCQAEVVRKTHNAQSNYPSGVGLKFVDQSDYMKQSICETLYENSGMIH